MSNTYFTQATLDFLQQLKNNNDREWFQANKQRYEEHIRTPALTLIEDIAPTLQLIAPRFRAIPKKTGGSLMRVQRDTRFAKDKTPYKTNIGISSATRPARTCMRRAITCTSSRAAFSSASASGDQT